MFIDLDTCVAAAEDHSRLYRLALRVCRMADGSFGWATIGPLPAGTTILFEIVPE